MQFHQKGHAFGKTVHCLFGVEYTSLSWMALMIGYWEIVGNTLNLRPCCFQDCLTSCDQGDFS